MAANSGIKLSNVIGAPFDSFVLEQLYLRAAKNSTLTRSNEEVLFLANKSAWARLISSVNINLPQSSTNSGNTPTAVDTDLSKYINSLGLDSTSYPNANSLAKNWILEAGTSKGNGQGIDLRSGIGPDGAYGLAGTRELGYRPMPGLTGVQIETAGKLGSLRFATINFKVWNLNQLNVMEALYFRLGYTMLLEWGHTQYYLNPTINKGGGLQTAVNTFGINDPFADNLNTTALQQKIYDKRYQTSGNYDGMIGIVTNFNWSLNQEGGYDCSVKLVGKGSIIETLRINQSYKMPAGTLAIIQQYNQSYENLVEQEKAREAALLKQQRDQAEAERVAAANAAGIPTSVPKNLDELWKFSTKFDQKNSNFTDFETNDEYWWYTAYNLDGVNEVPDWYYVSPTTEYNQKWVGLFLQGGNTTAPWRVLHINPQSSRFALNNAFLEKATERDLTQNYNQNLGPTNRNKIYAVSDVTNLLAKKFEYETQNVSTTTVNPYGGGTTVNAYYGPNDPLTAQIFTTINLRDIQVKYTKDSDSIKKREFYFTVKYMGIKDPSQNPGFVPTTKQVYTALDQWLTANAPTVLTSIEAIDPVLGYSSLQIKGNGFATITTPVKNISVKGQQRDNLEAVFEISFNNTSFIGDILPSLTEQAAAAQQAQEASNSVTSAQINSATNAQTTPPSPLESALHLMLGVIKNAVEVKGNAAQQAVVKVPLLGTGKNNAGDITPAFFDAGVFSQVLGPKPTTTVDKYELTAYAQKGFNSYLMTNAKLYDTVPFVDFEKLATSYLVKYTFSNENQSVGFTNSPVYIKLGYLLALINNLCLIYDSNKPQDQADQKSAKREPYIFIDFNPETNFCLTTPQHLSVDPKICLIPFNGTSNDYKKIFPKDVGVQDYFDPKRDFLSNTIQEFKTNNTYQGKTMNILLNVDYLLEKANSFASADAEHGVYLEGYLNAIITDINKCLGNYNKFRVAYRDDSNTVQIVDDQFVPAGISGDKINVSEPDILNRSVYLATPANIPTGYSIFGSPRYGQLPIFGLQSTVRNVQFKTDLSTKMSNMVAISAQATTSSINSTDPTSFTYLNQNFQDRYKPYVNNAGVTPAGNNIVNVAPTASNNDVKVADEFNTQVKSLYSFEGTIDVTRTETAKNYYIERLSSTKAKDPVTSAAPFIPANLEITVDGVGGIVMGNAFTIPEDRLPNSLKGTDGFTKVGFIVVGLTHTVQENQWLTRIKGQMIKLRENVNYGKAAEYNTETKVVLSAANAGAVTTGTNCSTVYPSLQIFPNIQATTIAVKEAATYLKNTYPDVGLAAFAIIYAEADKLSDGSLFVSAGNNNFGGVQTDVRVWSFSNFNGQFCRRDSGGIFRMFASFATSQAFLDFLAVVVRNKGFSSVMTQDQWTVAYINTWWSPAEKANYTKGTSKYNAKLNIFKSAKVIYDKA